MGTSWVGVMDVPLTGNQTYIVDANVRGGLTAVTPVCSFISARLVHVETGQVIQDSERLVTEICVTDSDDDPTNNPEPVKVSNNDTVPISVEIDVRGRKTIRLEAMRKDVKVFGPIQTSAIFSHSTGLTTIRYF
ncbi:hypothetical protein FHX81_5657 [Saccharothrix saharensis]|uniref:Uncharacterized protein n=1 Tax=Saccharothrix saharensis TaxID=571190 RepID=A0A543JK50_9PSEU|nr:hypothetical protein FHX81_5657 [Saccharothrix saharensis]